MAYLGNVPAEAYSSVVKDTFSGDNSTVDFTLVRPATTNGLRVVVNDTLQEPSVDYTCTGTTLTFTSAPATGTDNIYVIHLDAAVQTIAPPAQIDLATTFTNGITVQGNIAVTGTVDGRDIATDGTKLDGIESGATADQTASEILTAIKTVDGAGSGLDADTVDGIQASSFLQDITGESISSLSDVYSSMSPSDGQVLTYDTTNGWQAETISTTLDGLSDTTITSNTSGEILKWNGSVWVNNTLAEAGIQPAGSYLTGNQTITLSGDVSGSGTTAITVTVADDSHNHIIGNVDGLQTALDGKASTSHNHTLDSLSNVTVTTNSSGEILKWDGTAWINNTLAEAGIQPSGSYLTGNQTITLSGDLSGSGTTSINAQIAANVVGAAELNVTGNGTTSQYLRSDGDGTFTWATPPDTTANQTITLSGDVSGSGTTSISVTVADDSHNHIISNIDNLQTTLDAKVQKNVGYTWTSVGGNALSFRSNDTLETSTGDQAALEVYQDTAGADAFMQFHVAGDYAAYFGLKGDINDFAVGGWSMGSTYYRVWHAGNDGSGSGLDADLLDGQQGSYYLDYNNLTNKPSSGLATNSTTIGSAITLSAGTNGMVAGPVTINATITIPTGSGFTVA